MKQIADGLYMLRGFPPNAINVYLADDIVIDAGTRRAKRRVFGQLKGHAVSLHALTHVHPDHQGVSKDICETYDVPLWCGANDVEAMETGNMGQKDHWLNGLIDAVWTGPPHAVDKGLKEGDQVGSFTVLDVPGHSRGHVAYWRESDRVLVLGDVLTNMNVITAMPGLHEPLEVFTPDPAQNRQSARKLATLEPRVVCFGHGAPLRDTKKFVDFIERLPE